MISCDRSFRPVLLLGAQAVFMIGLFGCEPGAPLSPGITYLGLPENEEAKVRKGDYRLRGKVRMTRVMSSSYAAYLELKKQGLVWDETEMHGYVYYAVSSIDAVTIPPIRPYAETVATLQVVRRYKAKLPGKDR